MVHVHEVRVSAARYRAAAVVSAHHQASSTRRNRLTSSLLLAGLAKLDRSDVLGVTGGLLPHYLIDRHQFAMALLPGLLALLTGGDGDLVAGPPFVDRPSEQLARDEQQELVVLEARLGL